MTLIFFLYELPPILELFPFLLNNIEILYICTIVTIIGKQCRSQAVLESGSWGHSVLQTPALVFSLLLIQDGLSVTSEGMCSKYLLTA